MNAYDPNYVPQRVTAIVGTKAVVKNDGGQILIPQRSEKSGAGGKWSLPGGGLELGEDPLVGIKREIVEETQFQVTGLRPYTVRSYMHEGQFFVIIGYTGTGNGSPVLNWEHDNYQWVTSIEALSFDLTDDGRYFIERFNKFSE